MQLGFEEVVDLELRRSPDLLRDDELEFGSDLCGGDDPSVRVEKLANLSRGVPHDYVAHRPICSALKSIISYKLQAENRRYDNA